jgi:hypothetical protein
MARPRPSPADLQPTLPPQVDDVIELRRRFLNGESIQGGDAPPAPTSTRDVAAAPDEPTESGPAPVVAEIVSRDPMPPALPSRLKGRRRVERTRKRDGHQLRRIQPWVRVSVERALKRYCAEHDVDQSLVVDEVLAKFLRIPSDGRPSR